MNNSANYHLKWHIIKISNNVQKLLHMFRIYTNFKTIIVQLEKYYRLQNYISSFEWDFDKCGWTNKEP